LIPIQIPLHGAKMVVSIRKADACEVFANEINKACEGKEGGAIFVPCIFSDQTALQMLVDETRAQLGKIDILFCNAATIPFFGSMMDIPEEAFDKVMNNNIKSILLLCQMVIPEMTERKDGSIIIVSSIGGLQSSTVIGTYNISKAADFMLVKNLAAEFGPQNVRTNAIAPGLFKTDFARALWENPEILKASTAGFPLRRIGEPDEIGGAAVFLASQAGTFVNVHTFVIDGGSTAFLRRFF
jgi:Dehydrogenases with different specificities (related to short-chain alcohol dehydrogenases)